jgi:hypothetical protein
VHADRRGFVRRRLLRSRPHMGRELMGLLDIVEEI